MERKSELSVGSPYCRAMYHVYVIKDYRGNTFNNKLEIRFITNILKGILSVFKEWSEVLQKSQKNRTT